MQEPLPGIAPTEKRCNVCKQLKPLTEFHRQRSKPDGLQNKCKQCNIESAKRYHADNADHCRERIASRASRLHRRNQELIADYLMNHPCVDCGETNIVALEFDHLPGSEKVANVSALTMKPWPMIVAEIAKCEVVCANCHRIRTAARRNSHRYLYWLALQGDATIVATGV